jgi:hypothetical protein
VEAYERSAREGGAQGSGLATILTKHARGGRRLHTLVMISLGRATVRLAFLAKPPSISRGRNMEDLEPPGLATLMLALAKPPSMSRGVFIA